LMHSYQSPTPGFRGRGRTRNTSIFPLEVFCTRSLCNIESSLQNSELIFRGRKLVLNYTGGSLCSSGHTKRALLPHDAEDITTRRKSDDDDDEDEDEDDPEDDEPKKRPSKGSDERRKSTIISLLCEKDPLATTAIAFVAASEDECTYFFEARTSAACGGIEVAKQTLGPGGVFGVM